MKWNKDKVREYYKRVLGIVRCRTCWRSRKDGATVEVSLPPDLQGKRPCELVQHNFRALKKVLFGRAFFQCKECKQRWRKSDTTGTLGTGTLGHTLHTTGGSPCDKTSDKPKTGAPLRGKPLLRLMKDVLKPIVKWRPEVNIHNAHLYFEEVERNCIEAWGASGWAKERATREQSAPPRWVDPATWVQWRDSLK